MPCVTAERVTGFEPVFPVWETGVLPLDDTRVEPPPEGLEPSPSARGADAPSGSGGGGCRPSCGRAALHHCDSVVREPHRVWGCWESNPAGQGLRLYRPARLRNALHPQEIETENARGQDPFGNPASGAPSQPWRRSIRRDSGRRATRARANRAASGWDTRNAPTGRPPGREIDRSRFRQRGFGDTSDSACSASSSSSSCASSPLLSSRRDAGPRES